MTVPFLTQSTLQTAVGATQISTIHSYRRFSPAEDDAKGGVRRSPWAMPIARRAGSPSLAQG